MRKAERTHEGSNPMIGEGGRSAVVSGLAAVTGSGQRSSCAIHGGTAHVDEAETRLGSTCPAT
jgi:hypothetical protein